MLSTLTHSVHRPTSCDGRHFAAIYVKHVDNKHVSYHLRRLGIFDFAPSQRVTYDMLQKGEQVRGAPFGGDFLGCSCSPAYDSVLLRRKVMYK